MCALGATLLARAAANETLGTLVKGKGFYIEKTLHIDAPVEEVYAYWRNREWATPDACASSRTAGARACTCS